MSNTNTKADLASIARQQEQLSSDIGAMRSDASAMLAILLRIEGLMTCVVAEICALHTQHIGLTNRVRTLETPT